MCAFVNKLKSLKSYQSALKDSKGKGKQKWKIIWFHSPFSKSVKTNIGKIFLHLLSKHFPKNHKMHKLLIQGMNTVIISYRQPHEKYWFRFGMFQILLFSLMNAYAE